MAQDVGLTPEYMSGGEEEERQGLLLGVYREHEGKLIGAASIILFLLVWEFVGTSGMVNPMFTSAPSLIFKAGLKVFADPDIWQNLSISFTEFAIGYGVSVLIGVPAGILLGWYRRLNYVFDTFLSALYATPRVVLLPLLIIWFGIGINSKIAVIFLGAVFPILINTFSGVRTLDENLLKAARSFGANDRQIFLTIALQGATPFIITGLRLGVGRALIGVVVGELYAATGGIGHLISIFGNTFQTDKVFVGVFVIAAWGMVLMRLLQVLEERLDAWRPKRV